MCDDGFPNNLVEIDDWLAVAQAALCEKWYRTTGHRRGASRGTWACEIANRCRSCREHLSLPCSLLAEANEIGAFLDTPCYTEAPLTFLRLYLIILSEFVNQLQNVARLIGVTVGKPPRKVTVWANRWAKHRLHIMVQHHPDALFADRFENEWDDTVTKLRRHVFTDLCDAKHPTMVIDYVWLTQACGKTPNLHSANDECVAILAVPPLATFLDATIAYFRKFIDACLREADRVKQFESEHFSRQCWH